LAEDNKKFGTPPPPSDLSDQSVISERITRPSPSSLTVIEPVKVVPKLPNKGSSVKITGAALREPDARTKDTNDNIKNDLLAIATP